MDLKTISDLEDKIGRAVEMLADLKNEKVRQKKENEKLKSQFDEYRKKVEKSKALASRPGFDSRKIKDRLEKLAGKLAALEDSWS